MPTEKVTVFDALGQAGDLTIYGRREDVLVIRDTLNNQKNMVHLNLNSKNIMSSPYFYLQPNDVVYVEPNKAKAASTDAARNRTDNYYCISHFTIDSFLCKSKTLINPTIIF